jgi:PKD repeat protein
MKWIIYILLIFCMVGVASGVVTRYDFSDGEYNITIFNGTGVTTWTAPTGVSNVEYLVVAGGGGGGGFNWTGSLSGGGGGAGGVLNATNFSIGYGIYNIIVGTGGSGGYIIPSTSGQNSSFGNATVNISAAGGGSGGGIFISPYTAYLPGSGGSGGGNASNESSTPFGGTGITGQGYTGGSAYYRAPFIDEQYGGGGGGGAEAIGSNGTGVVGGDGGIGRQNAITGVLTYYGGGGGGAVTHWGGALGNGGSGGGGNASRLGFDTWGGYDYDHNLTGILDPLANGTNGLGGGGGGAADQTIGGFGGSGVVILRYNISTVFKPVTDFSANNTTGNAGMVVQFTDLSTSLSGITAWNWSFGDGNYSNSQNPNHIYAYVGQYSVTLISQSYTLSNSTTKIGYINVGIVNPVTIDFTANPTYSAINPMTVQFTDTSVCLPVCSQWAWDFNNDGAYDSFAQNPSYTYTYPGNYSVKLVAGNGINTGTRLRTHYIFAGPVFVPPTIAPQLTPWDASYTFTGNTAIDLPNSTFLKYWLQNWTQTGEFSVYGFVTGLMQPLLNVFGFWIYLIIWALYLFAVWIRSQDVTLPLIVGVLSIGTFGLLFPKESLPVIIIMFVVCGAIILTKLLKDSI